MNTTQTRASLIACVLLAAGCAKGSVDPVVPRRPAVVERTPARTEPASQVVRSQRSGEEQKAIAAIETLGAKIKLDACQPGQPVVAVDWNSCSVDDEDLRLLKCLPQLESLDLANTRISDRGLAHLSDLRNLRSLNLAFTEVTDAGLPHLEPLTNLESLYVTFSKVTADGAAALKQALPQVVVSK
jgi:hypothetical protein